MQEYTQFVFVVHNPDKFIDYSEIKNVKGFSLPSEGHRKVYLVDDNDGWADFNGCYYDAYNKPAGWVILSNDNKKFQRFDMQSNFVEERENKYYSSSTYDAYQNILDEREKQRQQYRQDQKQKKEEKQKNQNSTKQEIKKNVEQKDIDKSEETQQQKKQQNKESKQGQNQAENNNQQLDGKDKQKSEKDNSQKDQDKQPEKLVKKDSKDQRNDPQQRRQQYQKNYQNYEDQVLYVEKNSTTQQNEENAKSIKQEQSNTQQPEKEHSQTNSRDHGEKNQRRKNDRNRNQRNNKRKENQENKDSTEEKRYYILDVTTNSISKEEFIKLLHDKYKVDSANIIDFNEGKLKLVSEKAAISIYRANQKEQSEQIQQQFIVSI